MGIIRRLLHLQDDPVTDDDRAQLQALREVMAEGNARVAGQVAEARRLGRFFNAQNDRNHLAERLGAALRGK